MPPDHYLLEAARTLFLRYGFRAVSSRQPNLACTIYQAASMEDAVSFARRATPPGGVVLLSPAAPSYGYYRDYIERGHDFAAKAGLRPSSESDSHSQPE